MNEDVLEPGIDALPVSSLLGLERCEIRVKPSRVGASDMEGAPERSYLLDGGDRRR